MVILMIDGMDYMLLKIVIVGVVLMLKLELFVSNSKIIIKNNYFILNNFNVGLFGTTHQLIK